MNGTVMLPGWGISARVFDDLRARLAMARERRVVIGWSLGAQRALERARTAPHDVGRLVLIAATPCFVNRHDWGHGVDRDVFRTFAESLERDAVGTLARFASLQARGDARAKAVARALRASASDAAPAALHEGLRCLLETDLRPALPAIAHETLVIHGENDALVPRAAAEYLAQALPNARCEIVRGAAHAPFVSDPQRVAQLIEEFVDGR